MVDLSYLTSFQNGAWATAIKLLPDQPKAVAQAWRALFAASWWFDKKKAQEILSDLPPVEHSYLGVFARSYTKMVLGDANAVPQALPFLQRAPSKFSWLSQWLILEHLGRSRDFLRQAEVLRLCILEFGKKDYPEWPFLACFRSLEQTSVETEPLLNVILPIKDRLPDWGKVLFARLSDNVFTPSVEEGTNLATLYYWARQKVLEDNFDLALEYFEKLTLSGGADYASLNEYLDLALALNKLGNKKLKTYLEENLPKEKFVQGQISAFYLINYWVKRDISSAYEIIKINQEFFNEDPDSENKSAWAFFNYILYLCIFWQKNQSLYASPCPEKCIIIGESHCLSPAGTNFILSTLAHGEARFIMGVKMHHLGAKKPNYRQNVFRLHVGTLAPNQQLLITIGEIDCRADEGIWAYAGDHNKDPLSVASETVGAYIAFLKNVLHKHRSDLITIQGVPAPAKELDKISGEKERKLYLDMISCVNDKLKQEAFSLGWSFLDVYAATVSANGSSNGEWHLDTHHLKPSFYQSAQRWLLRQ